LKKLLFLIVVGLLVLGLVLAGCGGAPAQQEEEEEEEEEPVVGDIVFEDGTISVGIANELEFTTGKMQLLGATMAAGELNAAGVDIGGVPHQIGLVEIETGEASVDPTGSQGYSALLAKIDEVDFLLGGYRTEAVTVYREVAVGPDGAGVIFMNCGAGAEYLQHSVVDDYDNYKYWFKVTPPCDQFLAQTPARMVDAVARLIRTEGGFAEDYPIRAGIVADDAVWCEDLLPVIEAMLPAANVNLVAPTVRIDPLLVDPTQMGAALAPIAAGDPHIVVPILSGDAGVVFAATLKGAMPSAMSVGINVPAQFKFPWAAGLADPNPASGMYCALDIGMDTWAEEAAVTPSSQPFLTAFVGFAGDYPLYTAAAYDGLKILVNAIEAVAWYDDTAGVGYANTDDIIAYLEDLANATTGTVGKLAYYPAPGTTSGGEPALSEAQVMELYPHIGTAGFPAYDAADWITPPHTHHDIVYGPDYLFGLGAQWQWDSDAGMWRKFAVWPLEIPGADLKDQYGDWNFEVTGTKDLILNPAVVKP
jgi:branched-chain amino acid transport system substrate-binding protein